MLTTIGSWFGLAVLASTPAGWVIGAGLLGGALFGGATWLLGDAGRAEGEATALKRRAEDRARQKTCSSRSARTTSVERQRLKSQLSRMIESGTLDSTQAGRILDTVRRGDVDVAEVMKLLDTSRASRVKPRPTNRHHR